MGFYGTKKRVECHDCGQIDDGEHEYCKKCGSYNVSLQVVFTETGAILYLRQKKQDVRDDNKQFIMRRYQKRC